MISMNEVIGRIVFEAKQVREKLEKRIFEVDLGRRPPGFPFALNSAVDALLKKGV
jgi:hypothetical protein